MNQLNEQMLHLSFAQRVLEISIKFHYESNEKETESNIS